MLLDLINPLINFDLETTGVDPDKDRIVSLAAIKYLPETRKETILDLRFNPECPIPVEASKIHHIIDEDVKDSPTFKERAKELYDFFFDCDLMGYNIINFDIRMLIAEFDRAGFVLSVDDIDIIDAYRIFTMYESRTLSNAVKFYTGEDMVNAHDALADARAVERILEGQLAKYPDLSPQPEKLWAVCRDPNAIDWQGKLKWKNNEVTFTFGKHKGIPLSKVPKSYLSWALTNNVINGKHSYILKDALRNKYKHR